MNENINEVFELIDNIDTVVFESYMNVIDAINSTYDKQIMIMENTNTDTSEFTIFQEEFYQEATSKKEQRRMDNFLKRHNYDPKTKTIETDIKDSNGKKRRVNFDILENPVNGPAFSYSDPYENKVENSSIMLTRQTMKRKPHVSNGLLKHEEGHIAYRTGNIDKNSSFTDNLKSAQRRIRKSKTDLHEHDRDPEEYAVDAYAAEHTKKGIEGIRRALQTTTSSDVKMKRNMKKLMALTKKTIDSEYAIDNVSNILEQLADGIETIESMVDSEEFFVDNSDNEKMVKETKERMETYKTSYEKLCKQYVQLKKAIDSSDDAGIKDFINKIKTDSIGELVKVSRQTDNGIKERRAFLNSLKYKK